MERKCASFMLDPIANFGRKVKNDRADDICQCAKFRSSMTNFNEFAILYVKWKYFDRILHDPLIVMFEFVM